MEIIRVLLADDHPVVRAGIRAELDGAGGIEVVGEASTGDEALRLVEELCPDVLVLDVVMPGMDGVEATRVLRESHPDLRILALSAYDENECVFGILKAGANGYVLKEEALDTIVEAIRAASRGESWLSPKVATKVIKEVRGRRPRQAHSILLQLTKREREVLELMAQGMENVEIARALVVTEHTVKFHVSNIYGKLGVRSRTEAILLALREGVAEIKVGYGYENELFDR